MSSVLSFNSSSWSSVSRALGAWRNTQLAVLIAVFSGTSCQSECLSLSYRCGHVHVACLQWSLVRFLVRLMKITRPLFAVFTQVVEEKLFRGAERVLISLLFSALLFSSFSLIPCFSSILNRARDGSREFQFPSDGRAFFLPWTHMFWIHSHQVSENHHL